MTKEESRYSQYLKTKRTQGTQDIQEEETDKVIIEDSPRNSPCSCVFV